MAPIAVREEIVAVVGQDAVVSGLLTPARRGHVLPLKVFRERPRFLVRPGCQPRSWTTQPVHSTTFGDVTGLLSTDCLYRAAFAIFRQGPVFTNLMLAIERSTGHRASKDQASHIGSHGGNAAVSVDGEPPQAA